MDYYQHFLQPISEPSPCGEDLEYNPAFILLLSRLQPRLDAEYGQFTEAANPVNWSEVERECQTLLTTSRDIRLIIILIRCRLRVIGLPALAEGLVVLHKLLEQWPNELYPLLHDEGDYEPMLRTNALTELENNTGLLNDLRHHPLPRAVGIQCLVKDIERGLGLPRDENALPEATIKAMLNAWRESEDCSIRSLEHARHHLQLLVALLSKSLGDAAPQFSALTSLLNPFVETVQLSDESHCYDDIERKIPLTMSPNTEETPSEIVTIPKIERTLHASSSQTITSRAHAFAALKEVQAWFVGAEPGSPVILLLQFAIKTSGKSFTELLQLLPADVVSHLNNAEKE